MIDHHVLLWSHKQNAFHIETLSSLTKKNVEAFALNRPLNDYHPVYTGTREECDKIADKVRPRLVSREPANATAF